MVSKPDHRSRAPVTRGYYDSDSDKHSYRRSNRYRSYSHDSREQPRRSQNPRRSRRDNDESSSKDHNPAFDKVGKVVLAFGLFQVLTGAFNMWMKKKQEDKVGEQRRERRRAFARAKAKRRREEEALERLEREREEEEERRLEEEESYIPAARRIGYTSDMSIVETENVNGGREVEAPRTKSYRGSRRGSYSDDGDDDDDYYYESDDRPRSRRHRSRGGGYR